MKKIVFNGYYFTNEEFQGIGRHSYELLLALDKYVEPDKVYILAPNSAFPSVEFKNIRFIKKGRINSKYSIIRRIYSQIWRNFIFPGFVRENNAISVNTFLPFKNYCFDVMSIYDCTPERFYRNIDLPLDKRKWYKMLVSNQHHNIKKCKVVLTDSESAKSDIATFYNIDPNKIIVLYCGWQHFNRFNEDNSILQKLNLKEAMYFFSLGSKMPHKNINWLLGVAKKYPNYTFVISGSQFGYDEYSNNFIDSKNVVFTGFLKNEEIKSLMKHCKAFIHPSFYEGFGIPPLEAMSVGANCIVSKVASLPEVYKESVWYIDPFDYENVDLEVIMSSHKESNDIILKQFSWEKSAIKLWDVLKDVAK